MPAPTEQHRNYLIDLLRLLSAVWVAMFHFNAGVTYQNNWYRIFCKFGYLGVPVFFIISGYCICIAQQHVKTPGSFIVRRFFRIFPPYWFSLILVAACALLLKLSTGTNSVQNLPTSAASIAATFLLLTQPASAIPYCNWVYWTLSYEMAFYLLVFVSMMMRKNLHLWFLIALVMLSYFIPQQVNNPLFFFNELPLFTLGYALYLLLHNQGNGYFVAGLLFVSVTGACIKHPVMAYYTVYFVTVMLIIVNRRYPLKNNLLSRLGDYAYSVYLIHVPIGIYLLGWVKEMPAVQQNLSLTIYVDAFLLIVVVGLAAAMYRFVEMPSIKLGRKYSDQNRLRTS